MGRVQRTYAYNGREWSLADIEYIIRGTMTLDVTDEALMQRQIRLSSGEISEKIEQSDQESGEEDGNEVGTEDNEVGTEDNEVDTEDDEVDTKDEEVDTEDDEVDTEEEGDESGQEEHVEEEEEEEEEEVAEVKVSDSSDKESSMSESDKSEEEEEDHRCHQCDEEFEDEAQLIIHIKAEHAQREATKEGKVQSTYKNKLITLHKAISVSKRMPTNANDNEVLNEPEPLSDMNVIRNNSQQKIKVPQHVSYNPTKYEATTNEAPKRLKHDVVNDVVVTPETSKISCEICDQKFSAKNNLTRHIKSIHSLRRFPCLKCRKLFSRQDKLNDHSDRCNSKDPFKDLQDPLDH
jgi:hypothetical protein